MAHSVVSMFCFFLCFALTFTCTMAQNRTVPAIFVFGDSLVDVGNNNYLAISLAKANFPHNGVDFPGGKATGRFSNGKNAADLMAEKLGLAASPPAYLSVRSASNKTNAFIGGVSFASGGAGIMDGIEKLFRQAITFNKQIDYYSAVQTELAQQLGNVTAQELFAKSIYFIVIGSNDILGYFASGSTTRQKNSTPQQFVDSMKSMVTQQLKRIYSLGARKFVMVGIAAIGCCPSQRNLNKTGECNKESNYWSNQYNEGVKTIMQQMKAELKDINYAIFDTYNVLLNFIQKPADYGFVEVKAACCGLGKLGAKVVCLPISKYCPNRKDHVFWDPYHPTEAASRLFVDNLYDGSQQYVYPVNVKQLVAM